MIELIFAVSFWSSQGKCFSDLGAQNFSSPKVDADHEVIERHVEKRNDEIRRLAGYPECERAAVVRRLNIDSLSADTLLLYDRELNTAYTFTVDDYSAYFSTNKIVSSWHVCHDFLPEGMIYERNRTKARCAKLTETPNLEAYKPVIGHYIWDRFFPSKSTIR